jgi:uncharacterized repeat protein (TIGR01451 family)
MHFKRMALIAALAAVALAGAVLANNARDAQANNVPGEYSLEATLVGPAVVAVGSNFTVNVGIFHAGEPNYQDVTWNLPYNNAVVTPLSMTNIASGGTSATGGCPNPSQNDDGSRVLVGCIDLTGPNIDTSDDVWAIEYSCDAPGPANIVIDTVNDTGVNTQTATVHTHDPAAVTCANLADIVTTKTSTGPFIAGQNVTYTVSATNTSATFASSVAIGDDLPDDKVFVSCNVVIDVTGDTVPEVNAPCQTPIPGATPGTNGAHFAAFPNPFGANPPVLMNIVFTSTDFYLQPGLAQNGTITITIVVTIPEDQAGKVEANLGFAASTDNFGGVAVDDPDFLDDCDGDTNTIDQPGGACSDDNFDVTVDQVAPADVTITKTCPDSAADGDTVHCTVTVTNNGPSPAANVTVTDNVSGTATFVDATVTSGPGAGPCAANVCTLGTMQDTDVSVIDVEITVATGTACNEADVEWADPMVTSNQECITVIPPFNGIVKGVDGEFPGEGEDTVLTNIWLCVDQATDGIDNDGDSDVDNEAATCTNNNEGPIEIGEFIFSSEDCDTRNDDDDNDGLPVDGAADPDCPQPTLEDYQNGLVDKCELDDGSDPPNDDCEQPEGLGAFEFQLKFDHKIFDIDIDPANPNEDNNGDTVVDDLDDWANGRLVDCTMTIVTENDIRFGCVTTGPLPLGHAQVSGILAATITVSPEADLVFRIKPGKDNGVVRRLLDENCEIADIFGDIFPDTDAGLTQDCTDVDITVRRLEGDMDTDCDVDVYDAQLTAFRYGSFFGQLLYNQYYDLEPFVTGDFDIDIKDLQFVFGRDGSLCLNPIPNNQNPQSASGVGQP